MGHYDAQYESDELLRFAQERKMFDVRVQKEKDLIHAALGGCPDPDRNELLLHLLAETRIRVRDLEDKHPTR